jgi:hypothetical protein
VSQSHQAALIYDGVHLFTKAVEKLINETDLKTPQVGCDNKDDPYEMGEQLLEEINSVSYSTVVHTKNYANLCPVMNC